MKTNFSKNGNFKKISIQNEQPTVNITKNKSRLKVYENSKVFLNDGETFEFEIHNPTSKKVMVKIKLNGEYISTSGIVLYPAQRIFLERFIDSNNKFVFKTYEVKNNEINQQLISSNGDIEVEFYNEQTLSTVPYWSGSVTINTNPYYGGFNNPYNIIGSTTTLTNRTDVSFTNSTSTNTANIETGIVDKGDKTDQSFGNDYGSYESLPFKTYKLKILPVSQKPITINEIRNYCTGCGLRVKDSNWKFCPKCGKTI